MCELCRKIERDPAFKRKFIDDHNALWQNALALKITMSHIKNEMIEYDANEYYPQIENVIDLVIDALDQIETNSFKGAKGALHL
jgi:hypothetical protein